MSDGGYGGEDAPAVRPAVFNAEAEQALLGALMSNNGALARVSAILLPEHFNEPVHQRIYAAIVGQVERGEVANPVTLKAQFDRDGSLAEIGGAAYLARLAAAVVSIVNAQDYARTIRGCWEGRQLLALADEIRDGVETSFASLEPMTAVREAAEARLFSLGEIGGRGPTGLLPLAYLLPQAVQQAEDAWKNHGTLLGVTTGIRKVDALIGGMMPDEMTVLAGRPGMGKTTAAKTAVLAAASRQGKICAVFSMEMGGVQLAQWMLAETGISASRMRRGEIDQEDIGELVQMAARLQPLGIYIDDQPRRTVAQMRGALHRLKAKIGRVDLVVVDHIGIGGGSDGAARQGQTAIVTEVTGGLKTLAKEEHVPVLALSQLSRKVEEREDKRPILADLRDSGSIEQDADNVIFLYRAEYYLSAAEPVQRSGEETEKYANRRRAWGDALERSQGLVDYIVAKQRGGPTGTAQARFEPVYSRNSDLDSYGAYTGQEGPLL